MDREAMENFKGKYCKIVEKSGFCIDGVVDNVYDDSILFKTFQRESLISFNNIKEVISLE
jgi:hypothetical protein